MRRRPGLGKSQTVNNYISGGVGGNGGEGGIQGGRGGAGKGPIMNYNVNAVRNFTVNNHDLQIHNSNLYTLSGHVSLVTQTHRPDDSRSPQAETLRSTTLALEDGWDGSGRELPGVARNQRRTRTAPGPTPYAARRHISARNPLSDHEYRLVQLESNSNATIISSSRRTTSDPSSDSERIPKSNDLAIPTLTSHPSAGPQYPPHSARPWAHTEFSTPLIPDRPSSHPSLSGFTSARGNPDTSTGRDSPQHLLSYPTLFQGVPVQSVHGGTFITTQNVNHDHHRARGMDILHRAAALEALYDSAESFPQPKCHRKTRTMMLDDLFTWAIGKNSTSSICWLYGPAGAGKSAIMQTLCKRLNHRLGGSFFFKRAHPTRGNAKAFFATLAYQLALGNQHFKGPILDVVENSPDVIGRSMEIQLKKLIVEPCQSLQSDNLPNFEAPIFLIDGLDECEREDIQRELLRLISHTVLSDCGMLRIIIASRPEPHIREILEHPSVKLQSITKAFSEVEQYLRDEFSRIHHEHRDTMTEILSPWPSWDILNHLVEKSSGYFIYASTVIKFIDDKDFRPADRLRDVVHWSNLPADSDQPFEPLDQLYTQILRAARHQSLLIRILCVLQNFPAICPGEIEQLLQLKPGDVALCFRHLHSIFNLPVNDHISVYHASIPDFLGDSTRSGEFCVSTLQRRMELGRSFLKVLSRTDNDSIHQSSPKYLAERHASSGIHYLNSSVPPTADLVPLIRSIDPDFLLFRTNADQILGEWTHWLKKMKLTAAQEDLVVMWEDYKIMHLWDQKEYSSYLKVELEEHIDLASFPSNIMEFLQAWWICKDPRSPFSPSLFSIRFLLDLSWNDMRHVFIRPLKESHVQIQIFFAAAYTEDPCPLLSLNLGQGCLRLLKKIATGELPPQMLNGIRWGRLIADSCPKCPELLEFQYSCLRDLDPTQWMHFISWLRASPEPPVGVIHTWDNPWEDLF